MFDTVCTLPLPSNVFSQSLHPKESVLAAGLASGHVQVFRLPTSSDDEDGRDSKEGVGQVVTQWSTRRHKGSCRSLAFSLDGEVLFSGGNDGIVKAASASTGRVTAKIAVPSTREVAVDKSSIIYPLSAQTLLVATDSSALYLYDLRAGSAPFTEDQIPQQSHHPHDDYISSISPLPPSESSTSGSSKQWVTTGDTTLAVTDLRRGVLARSEDQEDELLSSVVVSGVRTSSSRPNGEKVVVGGAGGVLTLWERGVWRDQGERIVVDKAPGGGESLDAVTRLPEGVDHLPSTGVAVGMGNGLVRIVGLSPNKVIGELLHDEVESVVALGVDPCGRLFSAGGQTIKVWIPREIGPEEEKAKNGVLKSKKGAENHDRQSGSDEEDGQDDSDDEPETRARHKRRKRGKGGQVNKKKLLGFHGLD